MYLTALDLGSSQIKTLLAELKKDGQLTLLNIFKTPSAGFRRGEITDVEEAGQAINQALTEIRRLNKSGLKNIFLNVGGSNVKHHNSRGIVAVSQADNEIYQEDIDRVIKASQAINLNPNRMIIHTITREFLVDGIGGIEYPLSMIGNRLEVNSLIFEAFAPMVKNLIKCVEVAGGKIGGLIYNPLAASRAVLSKTQKELGVAMIDVGFGATSMAVYEENKLIHASVFPVGTGHVTNDLAIGLRCPVKTAEAIKLSFGFALSSDVSAKEKIDLQTIDETCPSIVGRRFIAEIVEVRLAEIFEFVNNELKLLGKVGQLPAGAVVCGGGAKMPGITELAKQELKLSVQLGIPEMKAFNKQKAESDRQEPIEVLNEEIESQIEDPDMAVAAGLLLIGKDQLSQTSDWLKTKKGLIPKILRYFIP